MRLREFDHQYSFKTKQYGFGGFRIYVLSDIEIDQDALPSVSKQVLSNVPGSIGFIDLGQPHKQSEGYHPIDNVFLAKEARRQGLGKILYNKAIEVVKASGSAGIYSDPEERNMNSDGFWRGKGEHNQNMPGMDVKSAAFEDEGLDNS